MRIVWSVLGVASVTVLLSGCLPPQPALAPTAEPTSTPIFASDEEALAAAEAAYGAYVKAVDVALSTLDSADVGRVSQGQALSTVENSVTSYRAEGKRLTGTSKIDMTVLTRSSSSDAPLGPQIYSCLDITGTDVVDSNGRSVVPAARRLRVPVVVDTIVRSTDQSLIVENVEIWGGNDFCV